MMSKHNVNIAQNEVELNKWIASSHSRLTLVNFHASWHEPCVHMNLVFEEVSRKYPNYNCVQVEAEDVPEISESFEIGSVPTFVLLRAGKVIEKLEGANAPGLNSLAQKYHPAASVESTLVSPTDSKVDLKKKLELLVASQPVMVFMKGTPSEPRCGFSRKAIDLLNSTGVTYGSFNILADEGVREGLKEFSNWPTYPQFYVNGQLIGGIDIVTELLESGELQSMLPQKEDLNVRLTKLVNQAPVMVFIKGTPSEPRCGFSRQLVALLDENSIEYSTFDILEDDDVRQGLKTFSDWPTFPQLYVKGQLVGGLDIVRETILANEFPSLL